MADFKAALPRQIKWSVGNNKYDDGGKNPKSLSLFIPLDSINAFATYIAAQGTDPNRIKTGKVWDYATSSEVEVEGIYINGKGKEGQYGSYGNINPAASQPSNDSEMPF